MDLRRFRHLSLPRFSGGSLIQWALALAVSLILWVVAMGGRSFTFTMHLGVVPPEVPPEYIVLDGPVSDTVRVTFSGEGIGGLREQMTATPVALQWSWPPVSVGESFPRTVNHEFSRGDLRFEDGSYSGIGVVSFSPQSITVTVDRQIGRTLPVRAAAAGDVPSRYYWTELSDDSVEVVGAATVLSGMDSCLTAAVLPETRSAGTGFELPEGISGVHPATVSVRLLPPVPVVTSRTTSPTDNLY